MAPSAERAARGPRRAGGLWRGLLLLAMLLGAAVAGCAWTPRLLPAIQAAAGRTGSAAGVAPDRQPDALRARRTGYGSLALTIYWPLGPGRDLGGYHAQIIPDSTSRIDVAVLRAGGAIATGSVDRAQGEATASLLLEEVPVGTNLAVVADAYAGDSGPIARGSAAGLNIREGATTRAGMTMFSLFTPTIFAFDFNAGGTGNQITVTGDHFQPGWAGDLTINFEGTGGSSVSIQVTPTDDDHFSFDVPVGAAIGRIEVVADGVPSYTNAVFWAVSALAIDATRAAGDPGAAAGRDLVYDDTITFTAYPTWALAPDRDATDYGTPPEPTWPENGASGTFSAAVGPSSDFTALATAGDVAVTALLGALPSDAIVARVRAIGAFGAGGTSLETARIDPVSEIVGDHVYVLGGRSDQILSSVERAAIDADGDLGAFSSAGQPALVAPIMEHASAVVGEYLYLLGGSDQIGVTSAVRSVWRSHIDASGNLEGFEDYSATSSLVSQRSKFGVAVLGQFVYAIGGYDGNRLATVERAPILDGQGNIGPFEDHSATARLATGRSGPGLVVRNGRLYVIGGYAASGGSQTSIESAPFDGLGNLGAFAAESSALGANRHNISGHLVRDMILIPGGKSDSGALDTAEISRFDPQTGLLGDWTATSTRLTEPRGNYASATIGPWVYLLGGEGAGALDSVERARIPLGTGTGDADITIDPAP